MPCKRLEAGTDGGAGRVSHIKIEAFLVPGHTGWSDDPDFVFAHKDQVCNSMKKQKPHDPTVPYDGYDERDDTEEKARKMRLASVNDR